MGKVRETSAQQFNFYGVLEYTHQAYCQRDHQNYWVALGIPAHSPPPFRLIAPPTAPVNREMRVNW